MHRGQFFHFLVAGPTLKFGPSYSASLGPNTYCLHPSSITRGGSFFGQARPGRSPSRANDHRSALGLRRPHQLVGEMFRRSSYAVATSRGGHRPPKSGHSPPAFVSPSIIDG